MGFNYQNYVKMFTGEKRYTFAKPDAVAAQGGSARTEYRNGLEALSKGLIGAFDANGDGKWDSTEFAAKECDVATRLKNPQYMEVEKLTQEEQAKFAQLKAELQAQAKDGNDLSFKAMDVNADGILDYKEVANEFGLADGNDRDGQNGTLDATGFDRIWSKDPGTVSAALKQNYTDMNIANLGEPGDIK